MAKDLLVLQSNLYEIMMALKKAKQEFDSTQKTSPLSLQATSTSSVYCEGNLVATVYSAWDRSWRLFVGGQEPPPIEEALNNILGTLFNHAVHAAYEGRQKRIGDSMARLDCFWHQNMTAIELTARRQAQNTRYQEFLKQELKGSPEATDPIYIQNFILRKVSPLNQDEIREIRHVIINFHKVARELWVIFIKPESETLRLPITNLLSDALEAGKLTLYDRPLYKALKRELDWTAFEGLFKEIPIVPLSKLHQPDSLLVSERKQLQRWIQAINQHAEPVPPKLLAKILDEVLQAIRLQGSSPVTLQDMIHWMDRNQCNAIRAKDPAQLDVWAGLEYGDKVYCNGMELALGIQLNPKATVNDNYRVFEVQGHPEWVVRVARNRFLLLLVDRQAQNEQDHWGVRFVKTIPNLAANETDPPIPGLDTMGSCVVQERLHESFDDYQWTSHADQLNPEDEIRVMIFSNHIYCMVQWQSVSELSHLMRDANGVFKTTCPLKKMPFNYNLLEERCIKNARENPHILRGMMHVSKLREHPIAKYYKGAVEHTIQTGQTDLLGRALPPGFRDDCYHIRVKELCKQAQELRTDCLEHIEAILRQRKEYSHKQEESLRKDIAAKLLQMYQQSSTPGSFPINVQDEIIAHFVDPLRDKVGQKKPAAAPFNAAAYYQGMHDQMMAYNKQMMGK